MTLFILTLLFALNFMFGMVQPYTSTAGDDVQTVDRVSDRLYTSTFAPGDGDPGQLDLTAITSFFEEKNDSEIRNTLGIKQVRNYNITLSSDYTGYGTAEGMLAYWPLNDRDSEQARDATASGLSTPLNGEIEGDVTLDVRGISSSGAYRFNGDQAAINVSHDPLLNPADTGNMTLSAWVKPEGTQPTYATIAAKGLDEVYQMHLESGNVVFEGDATGGQPEVTSSTTLDDGKWYHVVGVYQNFSSSTGDEYFAIYVNGELESDLNTSVQGMGFAPDSNLGIGNNLQDSNRSFNGSIDEVRLYRRALDDREIKDLYMSAGVLSPDNPDRQSPTPLENVTYQAGKETPSGQDIASVSSRTRVGYVGGSNGEGSYGGLRNAIRFTATSDNSQNSLVIDYGGVDVSSVIDACASADNAQAGVQPPCPGVVTIGIDKTGDGVIDVDASDDVECCPSGGDGVFGTDGNTTLNIETSGNYNIDKGETLIARFPAIHSDSRTVTAEANGDGSSSSVVYPVSSTPEGDVGPVEFTVRVW
jgi:hypothetical protein